MELKREEAECTECYSPYYVNSSHMGTLCPECSYWLYGYKNCDHQFENGNCITCGWNGNRSDYILGIIKMSK